MTRSSRFSPASRGAFLSPGCAHHHRFAQCQGLGTPARSARLEHVLHSVPHSDRHGDGLLLSARRPADEKHRDADVITRTPALFSQNRPRRRGAREDSGFSCSASCRIRGSSPNCESAQRNLESDKTWHSSRDMMMQRHRRFPDGIDSHDGRLGTVRLSRFARRITCLNPALASCWTAWVSRFATAASAAATWPARVGNAHDLAGAGPTAALANRAA